MPVARSAAPWDPLVARMQRPAVGGGGMFGALWLLTRARSRRPRHRALPPVRRLGLTRTRACVRVVPLGRALRGLLAAAAGVCTYEVDEYDAGMAYVCDIANAALPRRRRRRAARALLRFLVRRYADPPVDASVHRPER
jgi:hypothetical protein